MDIQVAEKQIDVILCSRKMLADEIIKEHLPLPTFATMGDRVLKGVILEYIKKVFPNVEVRLNVASFSLSLPDDLSKSYVDILTLTDKYPSMRRSNKFVETANYLNSVNRSGINLLVRSGKGYVHFSSDIELLYNKFNTTVFAFLPKIETLAKMLNQCGEILNETNEEITRLKRESESNQERLGQILTARRQGLMEARQHALETLQAKHTPVIEKKEEIAPYPATGYEKPKPIILRASDHYHNDEDEPEEYYDDDDEPEEYYENEEEAIESPMPLQITPMETVQSPVVPQIHSRDNSSQSLFRQALSRVRDQAPTLPNRLASGETVRLIMDNDDGEVFAYPPELPIIHNYGDRGLYIISSVDSGTSRVRTVGGTTYRYRAEDWTTVLTGDTLGGINRPDGVYYRPDAPEAERYLHIISNIIVASASSFNGLGVTDSPRVRYYHNPALVLNQGFAVV